MDISSLLSPQNNPQETHQYTPRDTPQPLSSPPMPMQSPRRHAQRKASNPITRGLTASPLSRSSLPTSKILQHLPTPALRPAASSPLVSPTASVLPNPSPPHTVEVNRQPSTASMDTLADLASMQNHQPARSAAPPLRTKDSFESQLSPSTIFPMVQTTSSTSNPRPSFDIAVAENPKLAVRTDFTGSTLSPELQKSANTLAVYLQQNPHAYESHVELIKLLHKAFVNHIYPPSSPDAHGDPNSFDLLHDLRTARENMDRIFAIGEDLWAEWIQDESMLAKTVEEKLSVMEKCARAVTEESGSVKLWLVFGDWLLHTQRLYHESSEDGHDDVSEDKMIGREAFSRKLVLDTWLNGAEDTMWRMNDSHLIWNRYIELVLHDLRESASQDLLTQVKSVFEARLQTPHSDWDGTFQLFSTFVSTYIDSQYEEIMVATSHNAADAKAKWDARQNMEAALQEAQEAGDRVAEYAAFANYIRWERTPEKMKRLSFELTNALYQRVVLRFPADPNLWEDHVLYLVEEGTAHQATLSIFPILERATRHCPWSGNLWAQYLLSSERQGQSFSQTEDIKHKATNTGLLDVSGTEEVIKVYTAWCTYLRRRAFQADSIDEDLDVAEMGIRSSIESLQELGVRKFGKGSNPDPTFRLERIYIKFLSESGSWDTARETFRGLVSKQGNSWEFWLQYYAWEMECWAKFVTREESDDGNMSRKTPVPHYATAVLRQAIHRESLDWPEKVLSAYLTHCEDHEDVEELQLAIVEVRKRERMLAHRREIDTLQAAESAEAGAVMDLQGAEAMTPAVETTIFHSGKRKRDGLEVQHAEPRKKSKNDPVNGTKDLIPATAEKEVKRDRENSTIFVQNLPEHVSETRLRQFFGECGTIKSLKLLHQDGTNAVIEFDEKEAALFAQTRDGRDLEGEHIRVQLGSGSTVFVANFPPTADEGFIRELFAKFGDIVDVRFPSLKYNTHRRFCYVQYTTAAQAQAATALDGQQMGGDLVLVAKISNPAIKQGRSGAMEEGREIYCRNLHWSSSEDDVKNLFANYGTVESVRIPRNAVGKSKGFCFVVYSSEEEANAALALNGRSFMSRELHVELSRKGGAKRQATTIVSVVDRAKSPSAQPNGTGKSPTAISTTSIVEHPSGDRRARTIALMNVPDTLNDSRLRAIVQPYGELVKVVLRPDHQGAIIEYTDAHNAAKASLNLHGYEIVPGRSLRVGTVPEMLREKAEIKTDEIQTGQAKKHRSAVPTPARLLQPSGPIQRPGQQAGRRGGLGQRRSGLGFTPTNGHVDIDSGDATSSQGGKKSNDDFRELLKGKQ